MRQGLMVHDLCLLLERNLRGLGDEASVQVALERLLIRENIEHGREVRLDKASRIDFMVGAIGVEVKVGGGLASVARQLERYARLDAILEIVLVTTRVQLARVPREANGKRIHVAALVGGIV